MELLQSIRGMNDILPAETPLWSKAEKIIQRVIQQYGYQEIRFPIVEKTEVFKRSIGEVTDIVEKEMYTFLDRNGDSLSLRPEGTASCVRACLQQGLLVNPQRLWYQGPMFRHERPQKGRYRQFHQIGLEAFGMSSPIIDAEIVLLTARVWKELGLESVVQLTINSLGSAEARKRYREALVNFLMPYKADLDEDSQRRLTSNPLRILDSKNPTTQDILREAPCINDCYDEASQRFWNELIELLDRHQITYRVNSRLVRGLDYYTHTVFEWVTDALGAQGTVCAGGRYDGLVELMGSKPTPAVGCAFGMERLVLLYQNLQNLAVTANIYLVAVGQAAQHYAQLLAEKLRNALPSWSIVQHGEEGSFKAQMKKADKSGAEYAIILGENELSNQKIVLKSLRKTENQEALSEIELINFLSKIYTGERV